MSFHYPRRVKDLPQLEPDSEDDFNTPQKANTGAKLERAKNANKENEGEGNQSSKMSSSTKSNSAFHNMRIPKRSAELPALESDSEEDENVKNDHLNCAILNDSFIMSPSKSEQDESSAIKVNKGDSSLSFIMNFDKMALNTDKQVVIKQQPKDEMPTRPTPKPSSVVSLQNKVDKRVASNSSNTLQRFNSEQPPQIQATKHDMETPFKSTNSEVATTSAATSTTTATTTEAQFATPQIRSFSVQRRPRDLCSTQSQKTRSAIVNEFRSQKVLFQTPMAMTRVPLPNDSITLGLCDTINETCDTPGTAEKTPQRNVEKNHAAKSKKSLEGSFMAAENQADKNKDHASEKSAATSSSTSSATTSTSGKETILNIKNSNYAILKKLGCGGSSSVYLARRQDNGLECALKVVDLHGDPAVVEGYLNETKLLAKLQGNVCVVALFEYQLVQAESKLYMVMEKGDSDLHKILQTYSTSLPLYVLMNFLYQMLQAVNYIHQNGVIHSDLKPANFLMVNGRLKLIDFGIASNIAIDSTSIIKFSQAGTFNYISPEALTDTSTGSSPMRANQPKIKISTKSDVWSLGCILYLLLYKKTPFSDIKNIYAKISAISNPSHAIEYAAIPPYYPVMLVHMTKNCLQHNPKKRPSCADLLKYPFNMVIPIQNLTVPHKKL